MTYEEQLNSLEWKNKREVILKRDVYKCLNCLNRIHLEKYSLGIAIGSMESNTKSIFCQDICTLNCFYAISTIDYPLVESGNFLLYTTFKTKNYLIGIIDLKAEIIKSWPWNLDASDELHKLFHSNLTTDDFLLLLNSINWKYLQNLHIHHKYYQINKNAWEYPDDALQTLCWECHETLHKNINIKVMDENGVFIDERTICNRCFGAGSFPEYGHVQSGICFKCNGARFQ